MARIKLVLSDIDGTVLNDQQATDPELKQELKRLNQQNIPFVLASARSPEGMKPIADELGLNDNPLACYNGALILERADSQEALISHELVKAEAAKLIALLQHEFPQISINLYSGSDWYIESINQWSTLEAAITKEIPLESELKTIVQQHPTHKFLLIGEAEEIETLLAYCQQHKSEFPNSAFYLSKSNYLEVTHRAVSKEKALQELAKYYHVPLAETLAIGDNYNDLPMISLAGVGIAMGNAPEEVKAQADFITTTNNEQGVVKAMQQYI